MISIITRPSLAECAKQHQHEVRGAHNCPESSHDDFPHLGYEEELLHPAIDFDNAPVMIRGGIKPFRRAYESTAIVPCTGKQNFTFLFYRVHGMLPCVGVI
jgi:hypothetical protein